MNRLLLVALLIYTVLAKSCIIHDKKGKPDIRVIELEDSSTDSSESEIVSLHLPDFDRRRREIVESDKRQARQFCKNDDDCGPGVVCVAHLFCVKGTWRTVDSVEATTLSTS
ncbi:PREDICTED: uncharacterized protein LOC105568486 [Vollenhovia emeryi]|uniref:uncharacterized protein LOC105568486 n=1 Tax=Vollenhovia emeryi TaxID=411798 RepID=UPI0005F3F3F9|nr:PREDICTED: uncharacterized protein LOC105568486 [Vollenhovia emeryi]